MSALAVCGLAWYKVKVSALAVCGLAWYKVKVSALAVSGFASHIPLYRGWESQTLHDGTNSFITKLSSFFVLSQVSFVNKARFTGELKV